MLTQTQIISFTKKQSPIYLLNQPREAIKKETQ